MSKTRDVFDPFHGKTVQVHDGLVDRLRGKYASGPHLPNGNPEFGWRQFQAPPIQHEAAAYIEALELALHQILGHGNITGQRARKIAAEALGVPVPGEKRNT